MSPEGNVHYCGPGRSYSFSRLRRYNTNVWADNCGIARGETGDAPAAAEVLAWSGAVCKPGLLVLGLSDAR